ncbi:hypothetical protein HDU79_002379 [Rhizoclosmatium sp. JEL0117]|nr:hypothetical protein HDU79_002379 [Rhizoclosmatium sp. JEL0117]
MNSFQATVRAATEDHDVGAALQLGAYFSLRNKGTKAATYFVLARESALQSPFCDRESAAAAKELARLFRIGCGDLDADFDKAVEWMTVASDGDSSGECALILGDWLAEDSPSKAKDAWIVGADASNINCIKRLAATEQSQNKRIKWLQHGASLHDPDCVARLAEACAKMVQERVDDGSVVTISRSAAQLDDPQDNSTDQILKPNVSSRTQELNIPDDVNSWTPAHLVSQYLSHSTTAASQNSTSSLLSLAKTHASGLALPSPPSNSTTPPEILLSQDTATSISHYILANTPSSLLQAARLLFPTNPVRAIWLFHQAAESNTIPIYVALGDLILDVLGSRASLICDGAEEEEVKPVTRELAFECYEKAVVCQESVGAFVRLGDVYRMGMLGVRVDLGKARVVYQKGLMLDPMDGELMARLGMR